MDIESIIIPAYQAYQRSEVLPTEHPPATWPIADHALNVLVKPFSSCGIKRGRQKKEVSVLMWR